ncbi:MAG: spore coat protein U domain-containing protein, partial [Pseudomonadales bacterium]
MTRLLSVIAFMLSIMTMPSAYAASGNCSFSISNISFGSVSTLSPSPVDVTATLSATCSGFSTSVVQICAASLGYPSGGTARQMTAGSDTLTYQLFSD